MSVTLTWDTVRVQWVALGEGLNGGEYNEDDPTDIEVLRFDVLRLVPVFSDDEPEWEFVDDASYCTQVPETTSMPDLTALAAIIMRNVYDDVIAGISIKKRCEELSWISPEWLNGVKS